jgi:hypothetical protein
LERYLSQGDVRIIVWGNVDTVRDAHDYLSSHAVKVTYESRINDRKKKKLPTIVDDVHNPRVYKVDSLKVGEQLSALEADIVDWH